MIKLHSCSLCKLFAVSLLFSVVCALQDISNFVTTTDLGQISIYDQDVPDLGILNAFLDLNPGLPEDLKIPSRSRGAELYVTVKFPDSRAIIGVTGLPYCGYVPVTYNGGPPTAVEETFIPINSCGHGRFKRGYGTRDNISTWPNLNKSLGRLSNISPETIIQAFVSQNNLPHDLLEYLKVDGNPRWTSKTQAKLYIPQGNSRYVGNVVVYFSS